MDVIHDHDGHVDDLLAMLLLLSRKDVRLVASTVCPGDCYAEAGVESASRYAAFMGAGKVLVAAGENSGKNPFPESWRDDSRRLVDLVPHAAVDGIEVVPERAPTFLSRFLHHANPLTVLATGPLTNLAEAIALFPPIAGNIERLYVMGGAVRVMGNVKAAGHDGRAEWNFFNNPAAAAKVFASPVPITLIPLDATNKAPVTQAFLDRLKAQATHRVSRLAHETWQVALRHVENEDYHERYYFWDTLAAAALLEPSILKTETMKLKIETSGPAQGRTYEDPAGREVQVGVGVNAKRLEEFILESFRR